MTSVLCAGMLTGSLAQNLVTDPTTIRFAKNPESLPEFSLKTVEGKMIASSEWQGKVVLLNFWATWCPPCLDEIPYLTKLQSKYADRLQVIGVSLDFGPPQSVNASLKRFVQQHGINYPVAISSPELQTRLGGILGLPTTFLLDEHRRIVQKHVGVVNPGLYETEIRALLGLPVDAKIEYFEDTGPLSLANAKKANQLPGVDLSKLTPERQDAVLRLLHERVCSCGCRMTLAECRIIDPACQTSLMQAAKTVAETGAESERQQARPDQP